MGSDFGKGIAMLLAQNTRLTDACEWGRRIELKS